MMMVSLRVVESSAAVVAALSPSPPVTCASCCASSARRWLFFFFWAWVWVRFGVRSFFFTRLLSRHAHTSAMQRYVAPTAPSLTPGLLAWDDAKKHEDFVNRMVEKGYTAKQVRLLCDWYLRVRKST